MLCQVQQYFNWCNSKPCKSLQHEDDCLWPFLTPAPGPWFTPGQQLLEQKEHITNSLYLLSSQLRSLFSCTNDCDFKRERERERERPTDRQIETPIHTYCYSCGWLFLFTL